MSCKKMFRAFLACLIATALFSQMCSPVFADPDMGSETTSEQLKLVEEFVAVDAESVPAAIGYETAVKSGFIDRLYEEEENLSSVVFLNQDNSKTEYLFAYPVKYVTESGEIADKTLKLEQVEHEKKTVYQTEDNDIITTFAQQLSDGVQMDFDKHSITMVLEDIPESASATAQLSADRESVLYEIDDQTAVEYGLTYMGFKEDIILQEYTGQTEFTFTLYTNGLYLTESNGNFDLCDAEGNVKAFIGEIVVFTADERNNTFGELSAETMVEHEEYKMTISLTKEYLTDENTVYPIRIDPTIEVSSGTGAILDVTLNSGAVSAGTSGSLYIGNRQTYGITRILMRFPGLDLSGISTTSDISSAAVEIRDIMCEAASMVISVHTFTGNTWDESTAGWSEVSPNSYVSTALSSRTVSYNNGVTTTSDATSIRGTTTQFRYSFDITTAVKGWKNGTYSQAKGILFKSPSSLEGTTTYQQKTFAAYNRSDYKPSLKVSYAAPTVTVSPSSATITVGSTKTLSCSESVNWTSSNTSVATVSSSGVVTAVAPGTATIKATLKTDSSVSDTCAVTVKYATPVSAGKYYLVNKAAGKVAALATSSATQNLINGSAQQIWSLTYNSSTGYYTFATQKNSSYYLTDSDYSAVFTTVSGDATQWYLTSTSDGYYRITNKSTGRSLTTNGTAVALKAYANSSTDASLWKLVPKFVKGTDFKRTEDIYEESEKLYMTYNLTPQYTITAKSGTVETWQRTAIENAAAAWNAGGNGISISVNSSSDTAAIITVDATYSVTATVLAQYFPPTVSNINANQSRNLNVHLSNIEALASTDTRRNLTYEAVVLHELGHALGLADLTQSSSGAPVTPHSIMRPPVIGTSYMYWNSSYYWYECKPQLVDFVGVLNPDA